MKNKIFFISLGSNVGDSNKYLELAIADIKLKFKILAISDFYETAPVGYLDQRNFINAVVKASSNHSAHSILKFLQNIENKHGRTRKFKNGPRTLDLDLLLYDGRKIATKNLIVPHPRMWERSFVLKPLSQLVTMSKLAKYYRLDRKHLVDNSQ